MESCHLETDEDNLLTIDSTSQFSSSPLFEVESSSNFRVVVRHLFAKVWNLYIAGNTKPLTAIFLLLLVIGVNIALFFVAVVTHPVQIDFSLRAFEVPGHEESKKLDGLIAAKDDVVKAAKEDKKQSYKRSRKSAENPEVVIHSQYKRKWRLDLVYLAADGNIFTENKLNYIHNVEKNLMKHPKFQNFCWKSSKAFKDKVLTKNFKGCMPPNSLIDYFYRTDYFDGQAIEISNIQETLDYLLTKVSTFWYVDGKFGAGHQRSKYLRSQIHFGVPLPGYSDKEDTLTEQHSVFREFLVDYVKQLGTSSSSQVTVLYGSSEIYDYEIRQTFYHDILYAAISFGLIIFLLFILTSFSLWLTIFGLLTIVFSIPFSYFVYRVLLRIDTIGILTGTTAFVIIGIGVDDVFVFINVFRAATHLKDMRERMKHVIVTAGKATFFTSFTTAAAFGANALTKVPAVHDFGLFTCILVMSCWLMVVLLMPPSLFLWQRWFIKCEMCLCLNECCHKVTGDLQMSSLIADDDLEMSLNGHQLNELNQNEGTLHQMSQSRSKDQSPNCCTVTNALTALMNNFIAKPVLKYRYIVLIIYITITGLSIAAISHLKTASGRPQLFPSNTNLQKLLDLQFNLSSSYIDCSSCSGDLLPVHRAKRGAIYGGFRSPVRRSILGDLDIEMNLTQSLNFSNSYWATPSFTARDNTTMQALQANATHNATDVYTHSPSSMDGREKPVVVTSHNATVDAKSTATLPTSISSLKKTNTYERTAYSRIGTGKEPREKRDNSSTVAPSKLPEAKPAPTATSWSYYHNITTVVRTKIRQITKHFVATEKSRPGRQRHTTTRKHEKNAALIVTTHKAYSSTTPPLCPLPCTPAKRPIVDRTAIVFLVFGIKGVKQSTTKGKHFFDTNRGTPIYDDKFTMIGSQMQVVATGALVKTLCRICLAYQNNSELVQPGGADCFPRQMYQKLKFFKYDECQALVEPRYANGRISMSMIGVVHNKIKWMTMAFESTSYKGDSASSLLRDYKKWENFTRSILDAPDIPEMLKSGYQTSRTWVDMFSEIIAVNGAIYGITLSLVLCLIAVVVFTGNWRLSSIVFFTIAGALCLVVAIFWLAGWTLGAIEAISLSILVGTSVDYTVHLTEGYIMASRIISVDELSKKESRKENTRMALNHIGVSIFSSALTTLIAAIPLCFTQIQLFTKFGQILAINTGMSIFYTLTVCVSLLSIMGPTRFKSSVKRHGFAVLGVAIFAGIVMLTLYLLSKYTDFKVPGPTGGHLFQ